MSSLNYLQDFLKVDLDSSPSICQAVRLPHLPDAAPGLPTERLVPPALDPPTLLAGTFTLIHIYSFMENWSLSLCETQVLVV